MVYSERTSSLQQSLIRSVKRHPENRREALTTNMERISGQLGVLTPFEAPSEQRPKCPKWNRQRGGGRAPLVKVTSVGAWQPEVGPQNPRWKEKWLLGAVLWFQECAHTRVHAHTHTLIMKKFKKPVSTTWTHAMQQKFLMCVKDISVLILFS